MTISIDCRWIDSSGVGAYLRGCLPFLLDSGHSFLLLGNTEKLSTIVSKKNNAVILDCPVKPFSPREILGFPKNLLKKINSGDLYYSPYFNIPGGIRLPVYTTIHDIIFPDMPELTSLPGLATRMWFYRRAARRSTAIFTVSEFSKSRIEHHLGKKKPVINASNAVNFFNSDINPAKVKKKKTIIFIGNIKKHKGLNTLLDAFLSARESGLDYRLVIVGAKDNFRSGDKESASRLQNLVNKDIDFTGYIAENEKWKLLAESALLVQPSLYEGFGYPPLEAMLSGTPALVSDINVFREVYGAFPVTFFKAGDSEDLKAKMLELLYEKKPEPLCLPVPLREKYSFKKTTEAILRGFGTGIILGGST